MKRDKWFTIRMYIVVLAACICVIWLLGRLGGRLGNGEIKTLARRYGCWYYFDESGYMVTDTYIKWGTAVYYLDVEGKMLAGAKAPDGRIAQADGRLRWPEV